MEGYVLNQLLEDLKTARSVIFKPSWWTQHAFGRNDSGTQIARGDFKKRGAVCFCAAGAAWITVGDPLTFDYDTHDFRNERARYRAVLVELVKELNTMGFGKPAAAPLDIVANFNDHHTHAEVIDLYDRVIKRLETK